MFSDTFAGIAPGSVPLFIAMQLVGAAVAVLLVRVLYPYTPAPAHGDVDEAVLPHPVAEPAPARD
jgi:hypothetical protein